MLKLRRADCGHWISAEHPAAGIEERGPQEYPVYLCAECSNRATIPVYERKDVVLPKAKALARED